MTEEWRPVVGWEGYEISSLGRLRSYRQKGRAFRELADSPTFLSPLIDEDGYVRVNLSVDGFRKRRGVHQLVAEAFLSDSHFEGAIVLHNNGSPSDNRMENIRWGTPADNMADRATHGTLGLSRSADEIAEIRRLYQMGFHQREIARVFKTTQSYVHQIVTRKQRKDVA